MLSHLILPHAASPRRGATQGPHRPLGSQTAKQCMCVCMYIYIYREREIYRYAQYIYI